MGKNRHSLNRNMLSSVESGSAWNVTKVQKSKVKKQWSGIGSGSKRELLSLEEHSSWRKWHPQALRGTTAEYASHSSAVKFNFSRAAWWLFGLTKLTQTKPPKPLLTLRKTVCFLVWVFFFFYSSRYDSSYLNCITVKAQRWNNCWIMGVSNTSKRKFKHWRISRCLLCIRAIMMTRTQAFFWSMVAGASVQRKVTAATYHSKHTRMIKHHLCFPNLSIVFN